MAAKKTTTTAKKTATKTNGKSTPRKESKTAKVIAMLKRGCTREQVLEATKWTSISMQSVAAKANLKLKVDDSKRPFVYRV